MWTHNIKDAEDTDTVILDENNISTDDISLEDNKTPDKSLKTLNKEKNKNFYVFFENYNSRNTPFNFKSYKTNDGLIFVLITLLLPFLINIIITYAMPIKHSNPIDPTKDKNYLTQRLLLDVLSWVITGTTMVYFWIKYGKKFIKNGGIIPFYFIFFMPITVNIIFYIMGGLPFYNHLLVNTQNIISTVIQLLCELVIIILIFTINRDILKRFKSFWKEYYVSIPIILCGIAAYFLLQFIFSKIGSLLPGNSLLSSSDNSNNQDQLNQLLNTVPGIVTLGIFTIIVAPITEELTTRHGIYAMSSNKWIGFVASALYFAGMHVSEYGDWQHIFDYLGAAIALSFVFLISNGNIYCTISIHSIINIISFIVIVSQHYK